MTESDKNESIMDSVRVGSFGWDHTHWQGSFYPDDLPADWRLSYYANEYRVVLLAADEWQKQLEQATGWCTEVSEDFRFYLQQDQAINEQQLQIAANLGNRFGGFVCLSDEPSPGFQPDQHGVAVIDLHSRDLRSWRAWLEQYAEQLRVVILRVNQPEHPLAANKLGEFSSLVELLNF